MVVPTATNPPLDGNGLTARVKSLAPGILLSLAFALAGFITWWFLKGTWLKLNALLWAFIYAIIAGNTIPFCSRTTFKTGIEFCSGRLLRFSIGLLGLTISAAVWLNLGVIGVIAVLVNLAFVFGVGLAFCRYVLKLEHPLSILIAVGTGICGASAIAATGPVIRARAEETGLALATVTTFGLVAMFSYPLLYGGPLGNWLGGNPVAFGLWTGMGIHETAQVVAAASEIEGALPMAMSAKFIRIFMIGPMIFAAMLTFRRAAPDAQAPRLRQSVPWFAVAFIALTLVHAGLALLPLREFWLGLNTGYLQPAVTFLLGWAFAGIGLKVRATVIRKMGARATIGGIVVAVIAGASALLLTRFFYLPFSG